MQNAETQTLFIMKFIATLFFACCLQASANVYSQGTQSEKNTITGRVTDEEGNPIAGVSVVIKGTKTGTATDENGGFSIEAGNGDILVFSAVSYGSKEIKITGESIIVKLSLQIKPLEQLVISGNVVAIKRKADVSSVTVLTGEEIKSIPGFNLTNILEGVVPGVTVSSIGTQSEYFNSRISIRGAAKITGIGDASAIKTYVDGVEYAAGTTYLAMINTNDIDRIEVVRGPSAATLYGSGASGGVILIFTKKGRPDKTSINFTTSAGFQQSAFTENSKQFQQEHNASFYNGIKNFSYVIGGNYRTQNDYLPKGSIKIAGGYANFSYTTGKLKFTLSNSYNVNDIINNRNPVFDNISGTGDFFFTYIDSGYVKDITRMQSGIIALNTNYQPTSWWTHNLVLGYTINEYNSVTPFSVYIDTTLIKYYTDHGGGLDASDYNSKDRTPMLRYNNVIKIGKTNDQFKMNILSGFEYSNTKHDLTLYNNSLTYTTTGGFTTMPYQVQPGSFFNYKREYTGAFLQLSPSLKEKYFLVAGLRYEKSNVSIAVLNPKIGFTTNFKLNNFTIKPRINWGRGITPPPYFITHPNPSFGNIVFLPNPDIKPQAQSGFDAAIEVYDNKGNFRMEIIRYDNIVKNGFGRISNFTSTPATIMFINIGKFANKGWEFVSEYKINNFKITANYSIIKSTFIDSFQRRKTFYKGDRVDFTPDFAAGASLNYTLLKLFGKSDRLSATLSTTSSGRMIALDSYRNTIDFARWLAGNGPFPNDNDYYGETSAVTKYNLNLDYQFQHNLKFFVQAQNFTNNTKTDFDKSYPVPGASWMFGLNMNFSKETK